MYFRGIIFVQLKRFTTLSEVIFNSRLNGNTRMHLWDVKKFPVLCFNPARIPKHSSNRSCLQTSSRLFFMSDQKIKRQIDEISDKFGEAMELLSDARSSMGTVYFSDDMMDAEAMVDEVCKDYERLLANINSSQAKEVTRAIGLKMEELKAQLQLLKESLKE